MAVILFSRGSKRDALKFHFWRETCTHRQVKAAWRSSCHRLDCLSVQREGHRLMIFLSFRGAILLTRRRSADEVLDVCSLFRTRTQTP